MKQETGLLRNHAWVAPKPWRMQKVRLRCEWMQVLIYVLHLEHGLHLGKKIYVTCACMSKCASCCIAQHHWGGQSDF